MPRVAALSATTLVLPIPRRPSARTVARLRAMWLIVLLTWVTLSLPATGHLRRDRGRRGLAGDATRQANATTSAQLVGRVQALEGLDGGPRRVDRVGRAVDLREDVADAGGLEDCTDGAAGDDAGALRRRLEQHTARAVHHLDLVGDGGADHRDPDQVLLCVLDALPDRLGDLTGLAEPHADVALAVTDDDDRAEAEPPAALDDLGDPVDLDDALLERELVGIDACHVGSFRSELEAGFAGGIGERLDPPVVPEPGSIEDDALDAGGLGSLGDEPPDGGRLLALGRLGALELLLDRRGGDERLAGRVVDDLRIDVVEAAEHRQARPCLRPRQVKADPGVALGSGGAATGDLRHDVRSLLSWLLLAADLAGLAGLATDVLARVADALTLVRLRLPGRADLRGDLADQLLVDADDREAGRVLDLEADPFRRIDLDRVAVAQVELELLAVERGAIADARDLEALAIAVGHADDHVVDQRPGQAVELLVGLLFGRAGDHDRAVLLGDRDVRVERPAEGALGPLHRDV